MMDDSGKCLSSFKVHDISRLLKYKFRVLQSNGSIDFDLADSFIISSDTGNVEFAKKSKEVCVNHQNILKQTDDLEKKLLDFEIQSHVNRSLKELSSKSADFPIEKTAQLSPFAVISNVQTFQVEPEELNSNSSNYVKCQLKEDKKRNIVQCFKNLSFKQQPQKVFKPFEREDVFFIATPSEVVFQEYEIGVVYEIPLFIKNVGQTSRNLRIIPPRTPFFSLGLGQFPSCTGSIAPGLHCMFAIKFCPDSLANFKDCLVVEVEQSNNLIVPLKAIRPPPILKMPASFDVGDCLLGKEKCKRFRIENEGAPGKFCFVPESRWPAIKLKTLLMEGVIKVGEVFEVKTICFELSTCDVIEVEVKFSPTSATHFSETLLIICDNCQLKRIALTGRGGLPKIEIVDVEGGWSSYEENEDKDVSAQHLLRFPSINLHSTATKMLIIKNCIDVEVPFQWLNFYSEFEVPHREHGDMKSGGAKDCFAQNKSDRKVVPKSSFTLEPRSGLLPACGIMKFDITFSPEKVGKYQEVIHFEVEFSQNPTETSFSGAEDDSSLTLEIIGVCSPLQVSLLPQVLLLPAPLPIQVQKKHSVKLVNKSSSKISFNWENVEKPYTLCVHPTCGEVSAESEKLFEVSLCSDQPYDINHNVCCFIDGRDCIVLRIIGEFVCPKLGLSSQKIKFGLVCIGQVIDKVITITNPSPAFISWFIHGDDTMDFGDLTFIPDWRGSLRPYEEQKVVLRLKPSVTGKIHQHLKLSPYMGSISTCFEVEADVQVPLVCLEKSSVKFCDARLKKSNEAVVKLINQTAITASFQWLDSLHDGDFVVALEPERGCIGARGSVECKITFYPLNEGTFSDIVVPCQIANSKQFVFLCISAVVRRPQESFEVLVLDEPNQIMNDLPPCESTFVELNYGLNNQVWTVARKYLLLASRSEEEVEFNLSVTSFNPSLELSHAEKALFSKIEDSKDDKEAKFIEQQIQCLQKKMFKNPSAGIAFVVHPSSGSLAPNEKVLIVVAALADTFGNYSDDIHCQVGCRDTIIPIKYEAKGCPVHFQMMAPNSGCNPTNLRFGRHYCGGEAIKRCVEVANDSSIDILLDWEMYFVCPSDPQVIDIIPDFEVAPDVLTKNENKVLKLKILTHKGTKINHQNLFAIHPKKAVVKAKGRFNFEFTFWPPSCATSDAHHSCIASSFVIIECICDRYICGHLSRRHKFELETLDLNLSADVIVRSLLTICYGQDEGFRFKCSAGDLMLDGSMELKACILEFAKAQILNEGPEDIYFDILTRVPFGFIVFQCGVALRGAEHKPVIKDASTKSKFWDRSNIMVLKPGARVKVKVVFSLTPDMLRRDSLAGGDCCEDELERKIHFMDDLRIRIFSSPYPGCGHLLAEQKLPLYATVASPKLSLSMDCIDFGVCFVNQLSKKELTITNSSSSDSYWMIESCPPCDEFQVLPPCGTLGKYSNKTVALEVYFMPREAKNFQGRFVIHGLLEEPARELIVMGIGTLDEHFMSL